MITDITCTLEALALIIMSIKGVFAALKSVENIVNFTTGLIKNQLMVTQQACPPWANVSAAAFH